MANKKGSFIVFEGTEGCGKTTQLKLFEKYLKKNGFDVLVTREPGGTDLGKKLRQILLHSKKEFGPTSETLIYMASRAQLVREVIQPALKAGKIVLCDRWLDATIAYQGFGLGVSVKWINQIADEVVGKASPQLTYFLDLPVKEGLKRAKKRGKLDRIEKRSLDFHTKVRKGYLHQIKERKRLYRIKVSSIEKTHKNIIKLFHENI